MKKIAMENKQDAVLGFDFEKININQIQKGFNDHLPKKEYMNLEEYLKEIITYKELVKNEIINNDELDIFVSGEITRTEFKINKDKNQENPFNRNDDLFGESEEDGGITLDNIFSWSEIKKEKYEPNQWVIKDLIPERGMTFLAGISGEGKTWVALYMAQCISEGKSFLGQERFKIKKKKVLYIDFENGKREMQTRGLKLDISENEKIAFGFPERINLQSEEQIEKLFEIIDLDNYQVIIIDTFRAVSGGLKEEKAEEVRTFLNNFKPLKDKEVAVIWLDHFRKPARFEGKVPKKEFLFGSQDKVGSIEVLLMLKKENDTISVYQTKNRLSPEIKPFNIRMIDNTDYDGNIVGVTLQYDGEIDEKDTKMEEAVNAIPGVLKDGPRTTKEIETILLETFKIGNKNARAGLKESEKLGIVGKRPNSQPKGRGNEYYLIINPDEIGPDDESDLFGNR